MIIFVLVLEILGVILVELLLYYGIISVSNLIEQPAKITSYSKP